MDNKLTKELMHSMVEENFLSHHGIIGQKWGKRHGPPYPLDSKISKKITKAHKKKNGKKPVKDKEFKVGYVSKVASVLLGDPDTDNSLNYFRGVSSTPVNVAGIIGSKNGAFMRTLDRPGHKITMDDLKNVNVSGGQTYNTSSERTHNCALCSSALALRSLGYNVVSGTVNPKLGGTLTGYGEQWFDGAVRYKERSAIDAYKRMVGFGNQGKGFIDMSFKTGGGHSVYFQNERGKDGKIHPVVYDGQVGQRYEKFSDFLKEYEPSFKERRVDGLPVGSGMHITRVNGATPNWKALEQDRVVQVDRAIIPKVTSRVLPESGRKLYKLENYYKASGDSITATNISAIDDALTRYARGDSSIVREDY